MKSNDDLYREMILPMAAGSIPWSLLTVLVTQERTQTPARALVLLLLGIYACLEWMRLGGPGTRRWSWLGSTIYILVMAAFAIAVAELEDERKLVYYLQAVFVAGILGHVMRLWTQYWPRARYMVFLNAVGLILTWVIGKFLPGVKLFVLAIAIGGVLLAWVLGRLTEAEKKPVTA